MERYAYLLGLYLGDGCLARYERTWGLRIFMDRRYPAIVEECRAAIETVSPTGKASVYLPDRDGSAVVYGYSSSWPDFFSQHDAGKKHLRPILLAPWQREIVDEHTGSFLRGLIQSDGWRGVNRVQVKGRWYQWGRWHISVARKDAVSRLDEFVGLKA